MTRNSTSFALFGSWLLAAGKVCTCYPELCPGKLDLHAEPETGTEAWLLPAVGSDPAHRRAGGALDEIRVAVGDVRMYNDNTTALRPEREAVVCACFDVATLPIL